jgi:hypothetical protein
LGKYFPKPESSLNAASARDRVRTISGVYFISGGSGAGIKARYPCIVLMIFPVWGARKSFLFIETLSLEDRFQSKRSFVKLYIKIYKEK